MSKVGDLTPITSQELAELIGNVDGVACTAGAGGTGPDATTAIDGEAS